MLPARTPAHDEVYLRRAGTRQAPPPGWATHPAGRVGGVDLEFVYRPDRHDVCRALNPLNDKVTAGLAGAGYRKAAAFDGGGALWVRERSAAVRARLAGFSVLDGGRARQR